MATEERASTGLTESPSRPAEGTRRAYEAPQLRHLGSVRQLTLGPTGLSPDTGGGGMLMAMSSRDVKDGIVYVDDVERKRLSQEVLGLKLATYSYKDGAQPSLPSEHRCLGFIIEDAPEAPFVVRPRKEVDLYAFASAILATVQEQQKTIARLEHELGELRAKPVG